MTNSLYKIMWVDDERGSPYELIPTRYRSLQQQPGGYSAAIQEEKEVLSID